MCRPAGLQPGDVRALIEAATDYDCHVAGRLLMRPLDVVLIASILILGLMCLAF